MTRDTTTERLSEAVRVLLDEAREHGKSSRWVDALAKNHEALGLAEDANDEFGRAIAHRYVGLSHYRLDTAEHLARSEEHLRTARGIAASLGAQALARKIDNHLGATLRQLGRYDEADKVFREALRETEARPDLVEVRARLLGNLGAMLDELDQHEQAADCYARYEELAVLHGSKERIANARGLMGRAALKRGEFDEAAWRFQDEAELAVQHSLQPRKVEALLHQGRLGFARWREAASGDREGLATQTAQHFEEAIQANEGTQEPQVKMAVRLGLAYGEFLLERQWVVEAYSKLREARIHALEIKNDLLLSKVEHRLAAVCQRAGLHGEALWYLEHAVQRRVEIVRRIQNERVRTMARAWFAELQQLSHALVEEALRVPRSDRERDSQSNVMQLLDGLLERPAARDLSERRVDPWEWINALRSEGMRRWSELVGDEHFSGLLPDSRADLARADVAYHGAIDDLGRSAHLMSVTMERELRLRLQPPLQQYAASHAQEIKQFPESRALKDRYELSLGMMLRMVVELGTPRWESLGRRLFPGALDTLAKVRGVSATLRTVDGQSFSWTEVRNRIAHGRDAANSIERVEVDAIKRALVLDAPVLRDLARWAPA